MHNKSFETHYSNGKKPISPDTPTIQTVKRELDRFSKQLRPSKPRVKPSIGDVLGIKRNLHGVHYEHYGIYSGEGRVIHYTGSHSGLDLDLKIMETSFKHFMKSDKKFFILNFDQLMNPIKSDAISVAELRASLSAKYLDLLVGLLETREMLQKSEMRLYPPEETVYRARSRLGEDSYSLLLNNCEHFAVWCKTGLRKSYQIEKLLNLLTPNNLL